MLRIHLIGAPRLERDGEPVVQPRGAKTWALMARVLRSDSPVSRQRLVDELFADANDPRAALRWALAEARRSTGLPNAFRGDPVIAGIGPDAVVDADEILQANGGSSAPEGQFLEGINVRGAPGFESWLLVERQRLDGEISSRLRQATLQALSGRSFGVAIDLAGAMVRRTPYEEGPHVLLIKAMALSGDADAAERQVVASETMFRNELGLEPGAALRNAARPGVAASVPGVSSLASAQSLLKAGLAAVSSGAVDAGIECLRRACSDAVQSGNASLAASCLVELGTALVHSIRGYDDEGAVVLVDAIEAASAGGDPLIGAKAWSELAYIDVLAGRRLSAETNLARAEGLASGDTALESAITGFQAMNLSDWGRQDEAIERFERALELSRSAGLRRRETWTLGLGARAFSQAGRLDDAEQWARQSIALAEADHWTAFIPWPSAWLADVELAKGRSPAEVRQEAEATFALARQLQDPCWEGVSARVIGLTYVADGAGTAGLEWMERAGNWCMRVSDSYRWVETFIHLTEAEIASEVGDTARAEAMARRAIAEAAARQMDGLLSTGMDLLASLTR